MKAGRILLKSKCDQEIFITPREQRSNFGLAVWHSSPQIMPECHQHNDIEINFLEHGGFTYLHGGHLVNVPKGSLVVFWAGMPHQVVRLEQGSHFKGLTVPIQWFLMWEVPEKLVSVLLNGDMVFPPCDYVAGYFEKQCEVWMEDLIRDTLDSRKTMLLEIEAWFRRVADRLSAQDDAGKHFSSNRSFSVSGALAKVQQMAKYISENYMNPITVPDVAEAVGLHPNYAVQLFRHRTGTTLIDFITMQRLSHAQMRLATSDVRVLDIAFEAGFGSASRFYAVFKEHLGMSPMEYREMLKATRY